MQECPGLNPDRFGKIAWFVMKKLKISWNNKRSNIFPHIRNIKIARSLQGIVYHFFWTGTALAFNSNGKFSLSKHDLKIISRGLHTDVPQIFNI